MITNIHDHIDCPVIINCDSYYTNPLNPLPKFDIIWVQTLLQFPNSSKHCGITENLKSQPNLLISNTVTSVAALPGILKFNIQSSMKKEDLGSLMGLEVSRKLAR